MDGTDEILSLAASGSKDAGKLYVATASFGVRRMLAVRNMSERWNVRGQKLSCRRVT
jgi:hypothetical protein